MKRLLMLLFAALLLVSFACAETLTLPADTVAVGDRAFYDTDATVVVLPDGLSLDNIGDQAFPEGVVLKGNQEGLAEWAEAHGYTVEKESRRYALCIGQTYVGCQGFDGVELPACANDAAGVSTLLTHNGRYAYDVTVEIDLTRAAILSAIHAAFDQATEDDVCLFYYSGHGLTDTGDLVPVDMYQIYQTLPLGVLRRELDTIKGTKIIVLDSCYSGNMVLELGGETEKAAPLTLRQLSSRVISAFAGATRADGSPEYLVLTACHEAQTSGAWEDISIFTYYALLGGGYDTDFGTWSDMAADADADGDVSLSEEYHYVKAETADYFQQIVQAYPNNSTFPLFGRD